VTLVLPPDGVDPAPVSPSTIQAENTSAEHATTKPTHTARLGIEGTVIPVSPSRSIPHVPILELDPHSLAKR
jgi:hypothetical protein